MEPQPAVNANRILAPVVVMGVSGSGKSTVGAALAQRLHVPFMDADTLHPKANIDKMAAGQRDVRFYATVCAMELRPRWGNWGRERPRLCRLCWIGWKRNPPAAGASSLPP